MLQYPLYQCPGEKKFSSGDTREIPAGTEKGTELSGEFSGKRQKSGGIPVGVTGNWELTLTQRESQREERGCPKSQRK